MIAAMATGDWVRIGLYGGLILIFLDIVASVFGRGRNR